MKNNKVTFGDLSAPLKTAVVFAWIVGVLWSIFFIFGMIEGFYMG